MERASTPDRIEWAVAPRALPGETVSGHRHLVLAHRRSGMTSDGVRPDFVCGLAWRGQLPHLADDRRERNSKGNDDDLMPVARGRSEDDE